MGKPTAIELLDIAYQGIRSRLSGYGGIFIEPDRNVEPKTSYDSNSQLVGLAAGVRTVLPDGKVIQILTRNRKDGPIWRSRKALHFRADSLNKVINGKYRVSASMAVRVAKIAAVGVDEVLAGRWPAKGTCPHCGHVAETSTSSATIS